jgi:FtsH-binding integral membrane protein
MAFGHARPIEGAVATAGADVRTEFIKKTYAHLAGAIGLFVLLEYLFLKVTPEWSMRWMAWALGGPMNWLLVLGAFMVAGWLANRWAMSATSRTTQYLGLGLYILVEVLLIAPLLFICMYYVNDPYMIHKAGVITLLAFAGLTGTVFFTRKDFSFLGPALGIAAMVALGVIVASLIFGFALGTLFAALMVGLAAGYILYYTSQVLAHYHPSQHVAASLALFAAIALMFFYVLRLLMSLRE